MSDLLAPVTAFLNDFTDSFWQFSAAMFVQIGILVTILLLVELCFRNRLRAVFRYWLWSLVLIKLMLPVTLHTPASAAYWLSDYRPATSAPDTASVTAVPVAIDVSPPVRTDFVAEAPLPATPGIPPEYDVALAPRDRASVKMDIRQPDKGMEETAITVSPPALQPLAWLFLGWLVGVMLLSIIVLRRALQIRHLVRSAAPAPVEFIDFMHDCCDLLRIKRQGVRLKVTDQLNSPCICGLWRPTILLPRHLLTQLDRDQFRFVFVHELAHWKRRDLQVNFLQTLLQIVYFYNPMVWIANAMLRRLREQAVDEMVLVSLDSQSQQYSTTLLDIASLMQRPVPAALQMIEIVESRKLLVQRIRRIVSLPIPKSARLGVIGFAAIALIGVVLLPMSGADRSQAADQDRANRNASREVEKKQAGKETKVILSGRILDETGAAVTDAAVKIFPAERGRMITTKTDKQGRYSFSAIDKPGEHRMMIKSQRWIGLERLDEMPHVLLSAETHTTKDVTLKRACQLVVEAVNEAGTPVAGVTVYAKSLSSDSPISRETVGTDKQGRATLGLEASEFEYLIATSSPDYAYTKLVVKLNDPEAVTVRKLVQQAGISVKGKAFCSDGKPPAGWNITALPDWWNFGSYPSGIEIGEDGLFTLPHIISQKYNVSISVPRGGQTSTFMPVLQNTDLSQVDGPLAVKLNYPSPASLVAISGRIRFTGGLPKKGFRVSARSDNRQYSGDAYLQPGETEFRIDPIPPGRYTLRFESPELDSKVVENVVAPSENLEFKIKVQGNQVLHGQIVRGDTKQPIEKFRVRAIKLRSLRGPNYVQQPRWQDVENPQGQFELPVVGPGIYMLQVAADGFAWARSEPINTDENGDKPTMLELSEGVSLSGFVVDEQGQPVDGAEVIPLSHANGTMPRVLGSFTDDEQGVETMDGKFTIDHLAPGPETLKVVHPDYTFAIADNIAVGDSAPTDPLTITLKRGGTVRGRVFDDEGHPEPNVTLYFHDQSGYGGTADEQAGRFATGITDENGDYEVSHLPEQSCYVHRVNEWKTEGVVRQAILPENGRTQTLNFGGPEKFSGRLLVNGTPLKNTRLVLSGENPHFGIFRAYTKTSRDGSFTIYGAGAGERTLYFNTKARPNDWTRIESFKLTMEDLDIGDFDLAVGRVTVNCVPPPPKNLRLSLQQYDEIWTHGLSTGSLKPRQNDNDPFVFEQVPPGSYELVTFQPDQPMVLQRVEVTPEQLSPKLTLELPQGTSTLHGKLDGTICGPGGCSSLKMWSHDRRLLTRIFPNSEGTYEVKGIPAGRYFLTHQDVRNAAVLLDITIDDTASQQLDITPEIVSATINKPAFRTISVYTNQGVPLPGCHIRIAGSEGALSPHSNQQGKQSFVGDAGTYDLTISYPGFRTIHQTIELIGPDSNGRYPKKIDFEIQLQPEGS